MKSSAVSGLPAAICIHKHISFLSLALSEYVIINFVLCIISHDDDVCFVI